MKIHTVAEVDVTDEEEHAALADLLRLWREQYPQAGLFVGVSNVVETGGRLVARTRLCHSRADAYEVVALADHALEEACAMLPATHSPEADAVLSEVIEARQALAFMKKLNPGKEGMN